METLQVFLQSLLRQVTIPIATLMRQATLLTVNISRKLRNRSFHYSICNVIGFVFKSKTTMAMFKACADQ